MSENKQFFRSEHEWLYLNALNELAESIGSTTQEPLSLHLFCLNHKISLDELGKIMVAYNSILRTHKFEELKFELFKEALLKECTFANSFSDNVIIAFIKVFAKWSLFELRPFAVTLDNND